MRKIFFILLLSLMIGLVLATSISEDLHLNIQTTDATGNVVTGTFTFTFNISNNSNCSVVADVVYPHSTNLTTDSRGIISYYLPNVSLDYDVQYWLCYYRDGVLINSSKIARTPYAFRAQNITVGGVEFNSNLNLTNYNITADNADFSGGWLNNGLSIIGGNIYAQVGYFYNITSLNVTRQNLTILDDFYAFGNAFLSKNLIVDTSTLFVNSSLNRVGIGTTSPSQRLHVNGSVNITENLSLGSGVIKYNDAINNYQYYNGTEWLTFSVLSAVPAGTIAAFNNETCPEGWIPANGSSGTPDLRGIFIRGAGTSGVLSMANGTNFSATYGEYQSDSFQGFKVQTVMGSHQHYTPGGFFDVTSGTTQYRVSLSAAAFYHANPVTNSVNLGTKTSSTPISDGTYGTPRTGAETRPASYALTYCMKTSDDSPATAGLIGSLGDNVFVQDASKNFGIGTTSPTEKLTVGGNITVTSGNDICISGGNCLSSPGGVSPRGTEGAIQFNDGGSFGGNASQFFINKTSGNVNVTGNVTADYFIGDGSQLTGITGGIWSNVSGVATYNGGVNITENLTLGNSTIKYNESANKYIYYNGSEWVELGTGAGAGQVPAGTISSFYLSSCPNGWILADGNSSTPDLRGIFIRGAGISGSYKDANGNYFTATYGEYQNDSFQGHHHGTTYYYETGGSETRHVLLATATALYVLDDVGATVRATYPLTDGSSGTPRTGNETRPANLALIYCMKTSDDSQNTSGLIGSSGDNVFVQNTSKNVGIGTITPQNKLNVVGDANITGNVTADYFIGDGSQLTNLNISSDAYYRVYDTGWVYNEPGWTNQHLGTEVGGNVVHNLNAPLSNLTVKVLISETGTDADSFEIHIVDSDLGSAIGDVYGLHFSQVDNNNILVQTGAVGLHSMNTAGTRVVIDTEDWYYKIRVTQIIRLNTTPLFGGTPAGAISSFYLSNCPNGWILADGNSSTPDLRGIFVRGAGISGTYKDANGNYFTATYGEYQNDSFQGHIHNYYASSAGGVSATPQDYSGNRPNNMNTYDTGAPVTHGPSGTLRTGGETRPANLALIYCMKTTEDSETSNTLFQESGGIISTANSSHNISIDGSISDGDGVIRTWHTVADPDTGWIATKTTGWSADSFSGGLEVDFSAVVPAGTKAVRVVVHTIEGTNVPQTFWRKSGDTNISNTPHASNERSHAIIYTNIAGTYQMPIVLWLSDDYKVQIAARYTTTDVSVSYPSEYYK